MDSIKNALLNQIMQAVLANKDQYLAAIEKAIMDFLSQVTLDGHNQPVIDEAKTKVSALIADVKDVYGLVEGVIQKYGHPAVTPTAGSGTTTTPST